MSARRRSRGKPPIPNLYEREGYFSWRDPRTREEIGLGRDRARAYAEAVEANVHIAKLTQRPRLIDKLTGTSDRSVEAWAVRYTELLARASLAENTRRTYKSLLVRMVRMLGADRPLATVTSLEVSKALENLALVEGKARLAQAVRNFMRDSFREARVQGWYTADNPILDTKLPIPVKVKRARLDLDVFLAIYQRPIAPWLKNAMAVALTSGQRREDVADAQFTAFHDGGWWCVQHSEKSDTPHRIFIPNEIKPAGFHLSLGDAVAQCRRTGVVSHYLIHQTRPYGNSPVGSPLFIDTLSKRFTTALEGLGIDWGEKTPPTFHEIRSLSARLYKAQGINTTELLGHTEEETTEIYHDTRGGWVRITV
jgi:hypothetical protein